MSEIHFGKHSASVSSTVLVVGFLLYTIALVASVVLT